MRLFKIILMGIRLKVPSGVTGFIASVELASSYRGRLQYNLTKFPNLRYRKSRVI